jgi:outer membrane protein assembly factor BamB
MDSEKNLPMILAAARESALAAGLFCLVVSTLMIATAIRIATVETVDNPALVDLRSRYSEDEGNEALRDEIRTLDLLARKPFFSRQWQLRVGGYLLLGGAVVFLLSVLTIGVMTRRLQPQTAEEEISKAAIAPWTRRAFFAAGGLILAAAVSTMFISERFLKNLFSGPTAAELLERSWDRYASKMVNNWPAFRGPYGNGIGATQKPPIDWDGESGKNVLWKVRVPLSGFGSPIVWDDRVFLSGADASIREVYCVDVDSGQIIWRTSVGSFPGSSEEMPDLSTGSGYAASTMATDGKRVFAIFANGDVACLDFSGNVIWGINLGLPDNIYGHSSSLLVYGTLLLVQYDQEMESRLMALDTFTGRIVWTSEREVLPSWSSPLLAETGTGTSIVINANPYLAAYDPLSGEELWRLEGIRGEVASSPSFGSGRIVAVNQMMSILAVDAESGAMLWQTFDDLPDASSPLVVDDLVIIGTSFGFITCLNAETGDVVWKQEFPVGFYASPVFVDDRIYLMDRAGTMRIFKADETFSLLGSPSIGEPSDVTPAFKNGLIFIRGEEHLFCIGKSHE